MIYEVNSFLEELMGRITVVLIAFIMAFALASGSMAAETGKKAKSAVQGMSDEELIRTARSAAPPHISDNAAIMAIGKDGKLRTLKEGTNEFTCLPDLSGQERPDPICGDRAATQWITSMLNKEPRPANTAPGIAYMGQGGWHFEKDGKIVMDPATPGADRMKEPPHWMVFWPVTPEVSALPDEPSRFGAYVMYPDSPYAHLMIYQDPMQIPRG